MTRDEAKREMMFAKRNVIADSWIDKAYDVAINALSQPEREDAISRQAAIDAPVKMVSEGLDWIPVYYIKGLPSAQPERKTGRWIDGSIPTYAACSECGYQERYADENNYCPNCGARMKP